MLYFVKIWLHITSKKIQRIDSKLQGNDKIIISFYSES